MNDTQSSSGPWADLVGHARPLEMLRQCVARDRLGQTYAFVGPPGIGKKLFALRLAQCLLCEQHQEADLDACGTCPGCRQVLARTHPDLFVVELPPGKSELAIELFVGDDAHRGKAGLCHDLSLAPMAGGRKVAIIDDADLFNDASGNALLKTLEEPPAHALLILIASSPDLLLPTIRSRCQIVSFAPLAESDVRRLLVTTGLVERDDEAAQVAHLADGSLETARQLLDPHLRKQRQTLYNLLVTEPFPAVPLALAMIEGLDSSGTEKSSQRAVAGWIVRFAIEFYRRVLWRLSQDEATTDDIPQIARITGRYPHGSAAAIDLTAALIDRCVAADRQLDSNVTIPLCLESLFDDLGRLQRS
ncbi:MAG: ATP-binding protein [Planctomycetales bacterium]